jgi:hypothetical protein
LEKTTTSDFKLIKQVKASSFDSKSLSSYTLSLLIGIKDFMFSVTTSQNECLYIEEYRLDGLKTINDRLKLIHSIFSKHPLLRSYKWGNIKLCFKSQKFTLVPRTFFVPESAGDYLVLNNELNPKVEDIYYYQHINTDAVCIFTADKKVTNWVQTVYPTKKIQVIHQGSAILEGIMKYDDHSHEPTFYCFLDRGIIHVCVSQKRALVFYNQFTVQNSDDILKYILIVFKDQKLAPKDTKLILWGMFNVDSPHIEVLKKYIKNIQLGSKPNIVKFPPEFTEIADHKYFDLYSLFLCD